MTRRAVLLAAALVLAAAGLGAGAGAAARSLTDSAGRRVEIPDSVRHVFPAGPPAAVMLYMLAPDRLLGWTRAPGRAARAFLPPRYGALPAVGRLTGRGKTVGLADLRRLAPDLVVDVGSLAPPYVALAQRVTGATGIPQLLIDGRLAASPAAFRLLGAALGMPERAAALAAYAEATLAELRRRVARVPAAQRPLVLLARGPQGLATALDDAGNGEVLSLLGVRAIGPATSGATAAVSPGQLGAKPPDIIIATDRRFYEAVRTDPAWAGLAAVRAGRVYLAPAEPFAWLDEPPSANRLIGLRWLAKRLYPALFPEDLRAETRRFYALFYSRQPSPQQLDDLLAAPASPP